jgi:hypothetical protein
VFEIELFHMVGGDGTFGDFGSKPLLLDGPTERQRVKS